MQNVKKSAVLCSQCSLIAHSKCAANAPPTCDLRSQLLLYAHFAERGSHSPVDFISASRGPTSVTSDGGGASSSRASLDVPPHSPPPGATPHPPTAYKVRSPFKRQSRQSLSPEPAPSSAASASGYAPSASGYRERDREKEREKEKEREREREKEKAGHHHHHENIIRRKLSILSRSTTKDTRDAPKSISSSSTHHTPSMRSMNTAQESLSSRRAGNKAVTETGTRLSGSRASEADTEGPRESRMSMYSGASVSAAAGRDDRETTEGMPGGLASSSDNATRRGKRGRHESRVGKEKENGCIIQ